ncbi:MAG: hypothetical protein KF847_16320 [Pirellulales bacterium]|nr:hypothetical protein [Pirellulales bacterium]
MREFGLILLAALVSSLLGAGFGWMIGRLSPEFLQILFAGTKIRDAASVAAALGAVCGLFLGAASMTAGLLITALRARAGKSPC